jgi:outer membrane protein OmpA-like peptidoglycan-associated protein
VECLRVGGMSSTMRGIRPSAAPQRPVAATPANATPPRSAPQPAASSSVDLTVPFAFDSAELTPQGAAALTALGTALADPALSGAKFRIAGHTDGRGTDAYNQALSERRAEAARRFLVEQSGVDAARLSAIGYGRRQLYDAANPAAASNRRVQVIRLEN